MGQGWIEPNGLNAELIAREQRCAALVREGQTEAAILELSTLLARDGGRAWAHAHLGDLLSTVRGDQLAALRHLTEAIELDSGYAWAFAHRGAVFERLDRFDEAQADLSRALELQPSKAWAHAMLARVYQFRGEYLRSLAELEEVIRIDRSVMPDWRAERGLLRTLAGDYELAHSLYLEALAHDAGDRLASYNVAINQVFWRGLHVASVWIDRARLRLSELPPVSRTRYEQGGLLAIEGKVERALEELSSAIAAEDGLVLLSPCSKRARIDLAWSGLREHPRFIELTRPLN